MPDRSRDLFDGGYQTALFTELWKLLPIIWALFFLGVIFSVLFWVIYWALCQLNPYRGTKEEELEDIDLEPEYYESELES